MDPMEPSPRKEKDRPKNAASKGNEEPEDHGGELSSPIIPSWPLGRPRSRLAQEGTISSQDRTFPPSGQYTSGDISRSGSGVLLASHPYPEQQSLQAFLPPRKRVLKSPQLQGNPPNGPHNYSMQSGRTSKAPPRAPAATVGSISQVVIGKSVQPFEDSVVSAGMRPHRDSRRSLKINQPQVNMTPLKASLSSPPNTGLGFQMKTTSAQPSHKESDDHVSMRPDNNPRKLVKMPQLFQPNKSSAPGTLPSHQNKGFRFHAMNTMSAQPQPEGSDADVSMRWNGNYSSQHMNIPKLEPNKSSEPPSLSLPNTGLKSHAMTVTSADPRLKYSNVDVSRSQSDVQEDIWSTLCDWRSARKRLHGKNTLPNVEEVTNVTRNKKTRLGWGQGLAKYGKEKREKELMNASALVVSGDHSNSSTRTTEMVACPDIVPDFSCGSTPSQAISAIGDQGSHDPPSGANGDPHSSISGMAEKALCPSASGCNTPEGVCDDLDNSTPTKVVCQDASECGASQGANCGILRTSTSKTERMVICSTDVPSFTRTNSPPKGENSNLADRSMRVIETVVSPVTVPPSEGCSLPSGIKFSTSTSIQDSPHKLTTQGREKIESNPVPTQGIELDGEIIAPPHHEASSHITTSNANFSFIIPKLEEPILRTLDENRSSDDEIEKDGSFVAMVQDISQGSDKVESSSTATRRIELAGEILAPPDQGPSSLNATSNTDFNLTVTKVEGPDLMNLSENKSSDEKSEQERKSATNHISVFKNSRNCISQSCSMLDGDASQADTNADYGDGENYPVRGLSGHDLLRRKSYVESCGDDKLEESTTDGEQNRTDKKNPELYAASNESNHGKKQSNQESPTSEKNCGIVTDCDELGGNGLVQKQIDRGGMDEDKNDDEYNMKRDGINSQHYIGPSQISGTALNRIVNPMDVENNDIILSPEGNEIIEPQHQISNEASRICLLSSNSGPSALQTVNTKSSDVKFGVDLNKALDDVASVDVYPSHGQASVDVNASALTTQIDLNIPHPASMNDASDDRGGANFNLCAKVEMAHDRTKMPEMAKDPSNQPGCIMLFGEVILQAPTSEVKHTSMHANQSHGCSTKMTSNMSVPFTATYGRSYPSGPWSAWSGVPIDSYHPQSGFSNQMPYGSVNGSIASPFESGRSASLNWRQVPHSLNVTPHSMVRGGVAYPANTSSSLQNFVPCFPDTSRPQAPGPVTQSTSNTRKGNEKIG